MGFVTHFQGIYQLQGNNQGVVTYGHEALLRGVDGGQIIPPMGIFSSARINGNLTELDIQSFMLACRTFSTHDPGGVLFVNIFPETLCTSDLSAGDILNYLAEVHLDPTRIVIEMVEGNRLSDMPRVGNVLKQLTAEGIRIALDDFGVGVGDLESWLELHPHIIKIDRTLIRGVAKDLRRQKTLLALELMTRESEARLVFEGVEYLGDVKWLHDNFNAPLCQGFLFGRPAALNATAQDPIAFSLPRLALCS